MRITRAAMQRTPAITNAGRRKPRARGALTLGRRRSTAAEAQLRCELGIAELQKDLATLNAPFAAGFDVTICVAGNAEDRRTDVSLLDDGRHIARALGCGVAGELDLRVADQVPHDGRPAAVGVRVAEPIVVSTRLLHQRIAAFGEHAP